MTLFIDKEINFKSDNLDFLKTSYVAQELFNHLYNIIDIQDITSEEKNKKFYFLTPILKGFLENIIKHDLPLQAVSKIDTEWLINDRNSQEVQTIFNKIYFPEEKDLKNNHHFIQEANLIASEVVLNINTWLFQQDYDPVKYLKKEFSNSFVNKKEKKHGI